MKFSINPIARWKIRQLRKRYEKLVQRDPSRWHLHETDYFAAKLEIIQSRSHVWRFFKRIFHQAMRKHWRRKERRLVRWIRFNSKFELNESRIIMGRDELGERISDINLQQRVNTFYTDFDTAMCRYNFN